MTDKYIALIAILKKLRLSLDLSQKDVSELMKKPQSYISKIEKLNQELSVNDLFTLLLIYRQSASQVMQILEGEIG